MCFTPQISLITALVEFILAAIILIKFRKSVISRYMGVLVLLLGFYQFTEFMLCISSNVNLWVRLGFVTYTFLPALLLHFILKLIKTKQRLFILYFIPIIFSIIAFLYKGFVVGGTCHSIFISVKLMYFNPSYHFIFATIHGVYYFGFIVLACMFAIRQIRREKDKSRKKLLIIGLAGVLLATIPAFLFLIIFPSFNIMFASVYCEFALLAAIAVYWVAYLGYKHHIKKKS